MTENNVEQTPADGGNNANTQQRDGNFNQNNAQGSGNGNKQRNNKGKSYSGVSTHQKEWCRDVKDIGVVLSS